MTFGIRIKFGFTITITTNFTYNLSFFRKSEHSLFRCLCLQETPENSIESHAIKNVITYLFASNKS